VIIGDIGHQLPGLLPDFESPAGFAAIGNIILRSEHRAQERREIAGAAAAHRKTARHFVETACRSTFR